jgi:Uma2 family endonuclease
MTTPPDIRFTAEEYLRIERAAEWKSEYIDGETFAMGRESPRHALITGNLAGELGNRLREGPCTVYLTDLRLATDRLRHYTYPDVVVACEALQFVDEHRDTITNPTLIAEVLSESTEKYDRGAKFERYRSVPTLAEYLLVSQERVHIELYARQANGAWVLREWNDPARDRPHFAAMPSESCRGLRQGDVRRAGKVGTSLLATLLTSRRARMDLTKIKYCKIHPAIGIARVGGSADGWFIGPEVPNFDGAPPQGGWKDDDGQILRQVARFRIYGYDANGDVIGEVTPGDSVDVTWRVHVANRKSAWYDFDEAMDIPAFDGSQGTPPKQSGLRNANVVDRVTLVNDPGHREITGKKPKATVRIHRRKVFGIEVLSTTPHG